MERYDRYKDSGIEWIGEIPKSWRIVRAKSIFTQRKSKGNTDLTQLSATQDKGMVPQSLLASVVQVSEEADLSQFKTVHKGDFVISLRSFQGGFELSQYEGVCSPAYQVFFGDQLVSTSYFKYLFKCDGFISKMNSLTVGIREGKNIQYQDFANSLIVLPSKLELKNIADYLDRQTLIIDSLVQKTKKSIELLQEQRKSVISEAVTKGLDPNVPMKDSGVEWIGEIPEGWDVARIKSIVRSVDEESIDVPLHAIMLEDIQSWTGKLISESDPNNIESNSRSFIRGDILFSKLRPYLAKAITAPFDGVCSGELLVLRSTVLVHKFLFYFLLSFGFIDEINAATYGAKMPRANWNIVGLTFLSYPEKEEQIAIAEYLDAKTVEIDSLIEKKKQLVEKLQEYRKSLISECVTGKVKVPGVE